MVVSGHGHLKRKKKNLIAIGKHAKFEARKFRQSLNDIGGRFLNPANTHQPNQFFLPRASRFTLDRGFELSSAPLFTAVWCSVLFDTTLCEVGGCVGVWVVTDTDGKEGEEFEWCRLELQGDDDFVVVFPHPTDSVRWVTGWRHVSQLGEYMLGNVTPEVETHHDSASSNLKLPSLLPHRLHVCLHNTPQI